MLETQIREATIASTGSTVARALDPLVERARAADRDGIEALLESVRPLVYRWAFVRTNDPDDAEDITQTVLIRVHERIATFEARSSFTTWLFRVTANAAAEQHRRRGIRRRLLERVSIGRRTATTPDPLAVVERERTRALLLAMMNELSEQQRVVLDLVDLQGFTPAEAAGMIGMNPNTLRVHLFRARKALRARILARETTR